MILCIQIVRRIAVLVGLVPTATPVGMPMLGKLDALTPRKPDPHVVVLSAVGSIGLRRETIFASNRWRKFERYGRRTGTVDLVGVVVPGLVCDGITGVLPIAVCISRRVNNN